MYVVSGGSSVSTPPVSYDSPLSPATADVTAPNTPLSTHDRFSSSHSGGSDDNFDDVMEVINRDIMNGDTDRLGRYAENL